jgi:hypothetical protein
MNLVWWLLRGPRCGLFHGLILCLVFLALYAANSLLGASAISDRTFKIVFIICLVAMVPLGPWLKRFFENLERKYRKRYY